MQRVEFENMFSVVENGETELYAIGDDFRVYHYYKGKAMWIFHSELPRYEMADEKHPDDYSSFWVDKDA